jgi:hypothetical protein
MSWPLAAFKREGPAPGERVAGMICEGSFTIAWFSAKADYQQTGLFLAFLGIQKKITV